VSSDQFSWRKLAGKTAPVVDEFSQLPPDETESSVPEATEDGAGEIVDYEAFDDVPRSARSLRVGARVVHERYGRGVIASIDDGDDPIVLARFPGFGERKVQAARLRFE
jgi:hypothetical protein